MDRLELISKFIDLPENYVMLLTTSDTKVTELIVNNMVATEEDYQIIKSAIKEILDSPILDWRIVPIGTKYLIIEGKLHLLNGCTIHTAG